MSEPRAAADSADVQDTTGDGAQPPPPTIWRIGEVTVTKIVESVTSFPITNLFWNATTEEMRSLPWLLPHFATPDGLAVLSTHALVVDTPELRIIVDTCVGNDKTRAWDFMNKLQGSFVSDLEAAGISRESIDVVLCTHLHVDHVGWNTMLVDGNWVPTFPNARYLLSKREFDFWERGELVIETNSWAVIQEQAFQDSVKPIFEAGLVDFVTSDHRVCEQVSLVPTPGHSPDHVSVQIESRGDMAIITGDASHHPSQLRFPHWSLDIDFDANAATETRRRLFADAADHATLMIGTHWAGATAGKVVRDGDTFQLLVEP